MATGDYEGAGKALRTSISRVRAKGNEGKTEELFIMDVLSSQGQLLVKASMTSCAGLQGPKSADILEKDERPTKRSGLFR